MDTSAILNIVESELQLAAARLLAVLPHVKAESFAEHARDAFIRAQRVKAALAPETEKVGKHAK
jgi:hypothetical protein